MTSIRRGVTATIGHVGYDTVPLEVVVDKRALPSGIGDILGAYAKVPSKDGGPWKLVELQPTPCASPNHLLFTGAGFATDGVNVGATKTDNAFFLRTTTGDYPLQELGERRWGYRTRYF